MSEYKELGSGKIECNKCGSVINKFSWSRHIKTARHLNGKVNKVGSRYESMRTTTNSIRERKIQESSIEAVRNLERLKKANQQAQVKETKKNKQPEQKEREIKTREEDDHNHMIDDFNDVCVCVCVCSHKVSGTRL